MKLTRAPRRIVALHWTDRTVQAVEANLTAEGPVALRSACFEAPTGTPDEMAAALGAALDAAGIEARAVRVVLPADQGLFRILRLPPTAASELGAMVRLQIEKDLPFSLEKARLAFVARRPEGPGGPTLVRAAVVRLEVFRRFETLIAAAGRTLAGMTLSPLVAGIVLDRTADASVGGVLVVEGSRLVLHFESPDGEAIVRSIPYGEHHLDEGVLPWPEAFGREFSRTRNAVRVRFPDAGEPDMAIVAAGDDVERIASAARAAGARQVHPIAMAGVVGKGEVPPTGAAIAAGALLAEAASADFITSGAVASRFHLPVGRSRAILLAAAGLLVLALPGLLNYHYRSRVEAYEARRTEIAAERKKLKPAVDRVESLAAWNHERFPWIDVQRDLTDLVDDKRCVLISIHGRSDGRMQVTGAARSEEDVLALVGRINDSRRYQARLGTTTVRERRRGHLGEFPIEFDVEITPRTGRRAPLVTPLESPDDEDDSDTDRKDSDP